MRPSKIWNFGPNFKDCKQVEWVLKEFQKKHNFEIINASNSIKNHEASILNLDISKSLKKLHWKPKLEINEAIHLTSQWFNLKKNGKLPSEIINDQINYYTEKININYNKF